jgi:hypothetical protein
VNIRVVDGAHFEAKNVDFKNNNNVSGAHNAATIYSEMSTIFLTQCRIYSRNNDYALYLKSSQLDCDDVVIEASREYCIFANGENVTLKKVKMTGDCKSLIWISRGNLKMDNCVLSGAKNGLEAKIGLNEILINDSDFYDISTSCINLEKIRCKISRTRFYNYRNAIYAHTNCKINVKNSVFEKTQDRHIYVAINSILKVKTSTFLHSENEGVFINHNCVSKFMRCTFKDSGKELIKCLIWCQINIINCYFSEAKKAAILLQGTTLSSIIATTIEHSTGGIYLCDSSNENVVHQDVLVESTIIRGIENKLSSKFESFGLLISCGMSVKIKRSYFLGAKIKCQFGGSLRISKSYLSTDSKKEKTADHLVQYCFKKQLQIISYCPKKISSEIDSNYIIDETKRPIIIRNCMQWKNLFVCANIRQNDLVYHTLEDIVANNFCLVCNKERPLFSTGCGHSVICQNCMDTVKEFYCPICLDKITHVKQLFSNEDCCFSKEHVNKGYPLPKVIGIPCVHDACEKCAQKFLNVESREDCKSCGKHIIYKRISTYE